MKGDLNGLVLVWGEWLFASVCVLFKKACQPLTRNAWSISYFSSIFIVSDRIQPKTIF